MGSFFGLHSHHAFKKKKKLLGEVTKKKQRSFSEERASRKRKKSFTPTHTVLCSNSLHLLVEYMLLCSPWALLARTRRKLWVGGLVGGHGGAVHLSLGRLVVVHSEGGVLSAVDARLKKRVVGFGRFWLVGWWLI